VRIHGRISAPTHRFVGLRYLNPPGGEKICLNSKLARCVLTLDQPGRPSRRFSTAHRAAFEILTDDRERHGLPLAC
jgi:hypothetical protein